MESESLSVPTVALEKSGQRRRSKSTGNDSEFTHTPWTAEAQRAIRDFLLIRFTETMLAVDREEEMLRTTPPEQQHLLAGRLQYWRNCAACLKRCMSLVGKKEKKFLRLVRTTLKG